MIKPKHLSLETASADKLSLEALYQICPACFTERRNERTGELERVVNFDTLRQLLGDSAVEDVAEAYEFTWVGKQEARREVARPIRKTMRPIKEDSVDWDTTQNIYIEGDNLEALKLLQKSYLGKVKMIYIDPPYNTGNNFVYNDNFSSTLKEDELAAGNIDELGNRYRRNTDTNGRFHSDWCSMIYSRLLMARNLLTEDGVIFISIDDNEQRNLKNICDEVFGEKNFVAQLVWERAYSPKNDAKYISNSHDYVMMYAKQIDCFEIGRLGRTEDANRRYSNPDNDPRGVWKPSDMSVKTYNAACDYKITTPSGKIVEPPAGRCWRLSAKAFAERLRDNRIWFGTDGNSVPCIKRFLTELKNDGMAPTSILFYKEVGHSQEGAKEVVSLFGDKGVFDGPKPVRLLERLITLANLKDDSIVLDFFSGSATTAHALMKINAEKDMQCRYILVQLPEPINASKKDVGYANICEIGKERIRRAGRKIKEELAAKRGETGLLDWNKEKREPDTGFRVFRIDESNMKDVYFAPKDYEQSTLGTYTIDVKEDRNGLDLLFGCMLDWGLQLSLPTAEETVDGCTLYTVGEGYLVACFSPGVTHRVLKTIAGKSPQRIVFRDDCFQSDDSKINVYESLKQLLQWSDDEVMKNVRVI
ncbi:MAG: site-specific DNA-methyltransferase [Prevotellaceae bacterium]|nr:site-specific DNA-methyltransferase [Prevotellaceae bacterium]